MNDGVAVRPAIDTDTSDRMAFIAKVYLMAFSGIGVFFATLATLYFGVIWSNPPITALVTFLVGLPWFVHFAGILGISFVAGWVSMIKGWNIFFFYLFAVVMALFTIGLTLYAVSVGGLAIVVQAGALTTLVMGALTAFVFITRKDFSFMGNFLFCGLIVLIGTALLFGIGGSLGMGNMEPLHVGLSAAAVLLFMGYVLYDTSNILHHYATDMVVPAALALMINFIVLFRNILHLLAIARR
jgi:FtsH-binding integral membrane protein